VELNVHIPQRGVFRAGQLALDQVRDAMRLMAEKARVIAEGAGALALAAALSGEAGEGPVVCVVSGGNIDLKKFTELVTS
jgi:threonine dehydratase